MRKHKLKVLLHIAELSPLANNATRRPKIIILHPSCLLTSVSTH